MTVSQWLGIGGGALLMAFIVFAFRQGEKVKPSGNDPNRGESYNEGGHSGGHSGGDFGSM